MEPKAISSNSCSLTSIGLVNTKKTPSLVRRSFEVTGEKLSTVGACVSMVGLMGAVASLILVTPTQGRVSSGAIVKDFISTFYPDAANAGTQTLIYSLATTLSGFALSMAGHEISKLGKKF